MVKSVEVRPIDPSSFMTDSESEPVIRAQKTIAAAGTRDSAKVPTAEAASAPPTIRIRKSPLAGAKNAAGNRAHDRPKRIPRSSTQRISATLATGERLRA